MAKKSQENYIKAMENNSCTCKSRSCARKLKLDLYYVKTNSHTQCQVNT